MPQYSPQFNRLPQGKFNPDNSFVSVVAGTDGYLLEDEFNELQWIQNEARASMFRKLSSSGFLSDSPFDFPVTHNEYDNLSTFSIYSGNELSVNIHGYEIRVGGNDVPSRMAATPAVDPNRLLIQLPTPPTTGTRKDLVFLEAWFQSVDFNSTIHQFGGEEDPELPNLLVDTRVNVATTNRVQLKWRIRAQANTTDLTTVYTLDANGDSTGNSYAYVPSTQDSGAYIAGSGSLSRDDIGTIDGYVYAIPICIVERLNATPYDAALNPNGSWGYFITQITSTLPIGATTIPIQSVGTFANGQQVVIGSGTYTINAQPTTTSIQVTPALTENISVGSYVYTKSSGRPDGMFNNVIYPGQVTDLRNFTRPSTIEAQPNSGVMRDDNAGIWANSYNITQGNYIAGSGTASLVVHNASTTQPMYVLFGSGTNGLTFASNGNATIGTTTGTLQLNSASNEIEITAQTLDMNNSNGTSAITFAGKNALTYYPQVSSDQLFINGIPFGNTLVPAFVSGTVVIGNTTLGGDLVVSGTSVLSGDVTISGALNVTDIQGVKGLVTTAEVGQPNGVAPLNSYGFVDSSNLLVNGIVEGPGLLGIAHFESNVFTTRGKEGVFSRNSIAYNPDTMQQVSANNPRFVNAEVGNGVLLEEGSEQLLLNTDIEVYTNVAQMFKDELQTGDAWTIQTGSVNFASNGATMNRYGWISTNSAVKWSPLTGTDKSNLKLYAVATFTIPTVTSRLDLYLAQDATNYYLLEVNPNNSSGLKLSKVINGVETILQSNATLSPQADAVYTLQLVIDVNGNINAEVYNAYTTTGTPEATLSASDPALKGPFMIGVGGDSGVLVTEVQVTAPAPNMWMFTNLGNENYAQIDTNSRSSDHSIHVLGHSVGSFNQRYTGLKANTMHTVSAYVNVTHSQVAVNVSNDNGSTLSNSTVAGVSNGWTRIVNTFTPDVTGIADVTFTIMPANGDFAEFWVDAVQLEPKPYATSYIRNDSVASGTTVVRENDMLSFPGELLAPAAGSVMMWVTPQVDYHLGIPGDYQDWFWLVGNGQEGTVNEFRLAWNQGYLKYGIGTQTFTNYYCGTNELAKNYPTHIALTWDTTKNLSQLYVNTKLVASGTANQFINDTTFIGRDMNGHYFANAVIDELYFFEKVIAQEDISRIYLSPTPVVDAYNSDAVTLQGVPMSQFVQFNTQNTMPIYSFDNGGLLVEWYNIDDATVPESGNVNTNGALIDREILTNLSFSDYAPGGKTSKVYGRMYGYITAPTTDAYDFTLTTQDGGRLYVNGIEAVNSWKTGSNDAQDTISLTGGYTYPIMIEFFHGGTASQFNLLWSNSTITNETIPSSALSWSDPWYGGFEVQDSMYLHENLTVEQNATVQGALDVTQDATFNKDITVKQNVEVDGIFNVVGSGTHNIAGQVELDGIQPQLKFKNNGSIGAPGVNNNSGMKIVTWDDGTFNYGMGVDTSAQWYVANQYHRWYDASLNKQMELNNANLWVNGSITSSSGTSTFYDINLNTVNVTPYASNAFVVGNISDVGSSNFAAAIAIPAGGGVWPLAVTSAGTSVWRVDPSGSFYFNNGFNLISSSGTHNMTVDNHGDVVIYGNLTVQGTQTIIESTSTDIGSQWIQLNTGETGTPTQPAGIQVFRGTGATMTFEWNEAAKNWSATDVNGNMWPFIFDNGNVHFSNAVSMSNLNVSGNESVSGNLTVSGTLTLGAGTPSTTHTINGGVLIGNSTDNYLKVFSSSGQQYIEAQGNTLTLSGNNNSGGNALNIKYTTTTIQGSANINGNMTIGSVGNNFLTSVQDLHVQTGNAATSGTQTYGSRYIYLDGSTWNGSQAITQGFVLSAGNGSTSSPTSFYLRYNNNGTMSNALYIDSNFNINSSGYKLTLSSSGTSATYGTTNNAALVSNSGGVLAVGSSWNWDYAGGMKVNTGMNTLDIGTADKLGYINTANTLVSGIRLMNNVQVVGELTVNNTNNPTTMYTSSLVVGQSNAGGAFLSISNANSANYIESANNTQNGNSDLHITGYNATQGTNVYLNFSTIYNQGTTFTQDTVVQDGYHLFFGTNTVTTGVSADNTDPIYIYRTNDATNSSGLHVVIGDNNSTQPHYLVSSGTGDYFSVETTSGKLFAVTSMGDGYVSHNMSVNGTLFIGDPITALGTHAAMSMTSASGSTYLNVNPNGNYNQVNINSSLAVTGSSLNFGSTNNNNNWINVSAANGGSYGYELNGQGILGIFPSWSTNTLYLNTTPTAEGEGPNYSGGVQTLGHLGVLGGNINVNQVAIPTGASAVAAASGTAGAQLAGSTTYYYAVTAITTDGETPISNVTSANTATTPHPVTVTWSGVQGASGYNVYRGTSNVNLYFLSQVGITQSYVDNGYTAINGSITPPAMNTTGGQINVNGLALGVITSHNSSRINGTSYIDLAPGSSAGSYGLMIRSKSTDSDFVTISANDAYANRGFIGYTNTTNGLTLDTNGNAHLIGGKLTVDNGIYVNAGDVQVKGKYVEVYRRPLFGFASTAGAYNTNQAAYNGPGTTIYGPFNTNYGLPAPAAGATRYYRLYALWSDNISTNNTQQLYPYLHLKETSTSSSIYEWQMNYTAGDPTNASRDGFSQYFQTADVNDAVIEIMINDAAKDLTGTAPQSASMTLYWLELLAYDQF